MENAWQSDLKTQEMALTGISWGSMPPDTLARTLCLRKMVTFLPGTEAADVI